MKKIFFILFLFVFITSFSQEKTTYSVSEIEVNSLIKGNLYAPLKPNKKTSLAILIAGSGPTDRNGNQAGMTNNSLKLLAEGLVKNDIAVFSYDKRIFALSRSGDMKEENLSFEDFIKDAKDVIQFFKSKKQYSKITIIGHSEGALIGMIAANENADAYISIAGAGKGIDQIIVEQIEKQAPTLKTEVQGYFEILKTGKTFELKNQMLASIFRASVQPYMISWIKYNPQVEIKKLKIPTLLINGTKDLQVNAADAALLKDAKPDAQLVIIENMNHIFKDILTDDKENMASYSNPDIAINKELIEKINAFIKSL